MGQLKFLRPWQRPSGPPHFGILSRHSPGRRAKTTTGLFPTQERTFLEGFAKHVSSTLGIDKPLVIGQDRQTIITQYIVTSHINYWRQLHSNRIHIQRSGWLQPNCKQNNILLGTLQLEAGTPKLYEEMCISYAVKTQIKSLIFFFLISIYSHKTNYIYALEETKALSHSAELLQNFSHSFW